MTRQIAEIAAKQNGIQFHITSLKPIRPLNEPTMRETACLNDFEKGIAEIGFFIKKNAKPYFFYMAPLKTEEACLQCHSIQGYNSRSYQYNHSI